MAASSPCVASPGGGQSTGKWGGPVFPLFRCRVDPGAGAWRRWGPRADNPGVWRQREMDALREWLQKIGLERYAPKFAESDVDLDTLPLLTDGDLEKLGISLGHRKKLLQAIANVRTDDSGALPRPPESYTPKYL